jgi:hypothetical protein
VTYRDKDIAMSAQSVKPSLTPAELVGEYFIENRNRLLEIAAFLDRVDRLDPAAADRDYRMKAFAEALAVLGSPSADRVATIHTILSDPTVEPKPALDRKGALGAYDRWSSERSGAGRRGPASGANL